MITSLSLQAPSAANPTITVFAIRFQLCMDTSSSPIPVQANRHLVKRTGHPSDQNSNPSPALQVRSEKLILFPMLKLVIQAALTHPEAVESLGHNVPRVFMAVFGGGAALAALAGVIGGVLRVTEPSMAGAVGAVVFAVIVIGGMGSLAGAFVASLALGVIDSFAVGSDHSLADLFTGLGLAITPQTFGFAVWSVKMSQVAAILPYLLLVLILIFRPRGLLGQRED